VRVIGTNTAATQEGLRLERRHRMSLSRKWRLPLLMLVALAAMLAFAACGDEEGGDGGEESPGATDEPAAGERVDGGILRVQAVEPASLDPHFSSFASDIHLQRAIWRGLYSLNGENEPQVSMASDFPDISADGTVYTITLNEGLLWSDGEPLTAEDFESGIKRTCNPLVAGEYQYVLTSVVGCDDHYGAEGFDQALEDAIGVTAVDGTTLEITLAQAQPTFTIILALWMTFPMPTHLFAATGDAWPTDPALLAYNGPYSLETFTPGQGHTLIPNPNWSAPQDVSPTLDKIEATYIDDLAVAANAYRNGELEFTDVNLQELETLRSEFADEYLKFLHPSTRGLEMQMKNEVLADINVRLALSKAIDREALNTVVVQGGNEPSTSWIPEVDGGHPPDAFDAEIGFDAEGAKAALAEAGFVDGAGFPTLTILVGNSPSAIATAEFLQDAFKTVLNIDTNVESVDGATRSDRFTNQEFDLFPGGWLHDYPDPENWVLGLFDTGGSLNNYNCSDPEIDALVEKARFNTDNDERLAQYKEINELISTHVCGIAPYWHENDHWLVDSNVVGMAENISGNDSAAPGDWNMEAWGLKS